MQQIKLRSHVGDDGILHLDIPSEFKGVDVSITLTVEALHEDDNIATETLSEARERLAKFCQKRSHEESKRIFEQIQQHYDGQTLSDSVELLREDRQR